ncbi:MAG: hypothetical protein EXR76_02425 [Myxococcales bacterium]|nr:hypothetical protein [Myxococcales bacterium]
MTPLLALIIMLTFGPPDKEGWAAHVSILSSATDAESALRLSFGHAQRAELKEALAWARTAESRGALDVRVSLARALAYRNAERWGEAANAYFEVAVLAPLQTYALVELWHVLRLAPPRALAPPFDQAAVVARLEASGFHVPVVFTYPPEHARAGASVAAAKDSLAKGETAVAVTQLHDALSAHPTDKEAWRHLGLAETRAGRPDRARAAYLILLSLQPHPTRDIRQIRRLLADFERKQGLRIEAARAGH